MKLTIRATSIMCVFKLKGSARDATDLRIQVSYICGFLKKIRVKRNELQMKYAIKSNIVPSSSKADMEIDRY